MLTTGSESGISDSPEYYPDTLMYRISKTVMKMQRLESHILTIWDEGNHINNALPTPGAGLLEE